MHFLSFILRMQGALVAPGLSADLAVSSSSPAQDEIFSTINNRVLLHLSLSFAYHPDMTEILLKRT